MSQSELAYGLKEDGSRLSSKVFTTSNILLHSIDVFFKDCGATVKL